MVRSFIILTFSLAISLAARDETVVKITGASSFSESELLAELGSRLDHITLHPTTPWRAADAAFLVEQQLQLAGFNEAKVDWEIRGNREIQLTIHEGSRDELGEVVVNGVPNPKLNETLVGLFQLTPQKRSSNFRILPLRDDDVDAGISLMTQQMKSIGFYDAEITLKSRKENPETGEVDFVFDVDAGKMFTITTPIFKGENTEGASAVVQDLVGEPATGPNLNAVRGKVSEHLSEQGYIQAKLRMTLEFETNKVRPVVEVLEAKRYELRNIHFTGLEKTNPQRIANRLEPLKGGRLNGELARERIGEIVSTGAFESVRTDFDTSSGPQVDATLHFKEGKARGFTLTGGFDSYEGVIAGASYYDRNFGGQLRNLRAGFEMSQRSLLGEVALTDPWLWGTDLKAEARLFALSKSHEGFKSLRTGLGFGLNQEFTDHYSVDYSTTFSFITNSEDGLLPTELGDDSYFNPAIKIYQILDYRDNPTLPTSGWHIASPIEIGAALGNQSSTYIKVELEGSWHHTFSESTQISFGASGGLLMPDGNTTQLPIDLRFFLGGARSVRSFPERELGPWSITGYPVGGEAYWVANFEYIRTIAGPLKAVAFVDAGGLTEQWEDFGTTDPEVAAGLGIRINLPIGPARLEYGHNLTRDGRDPSGTWHFAIGTTF
ncbi:MAG: BamA/OMP85 family outer membrane protein [Verrucomicrobiales bacterium]